MRLPPPPLDVDMDASTYKASNLQLQRENDSVNNLLFDGAKSFTTDKTSNNKNIKYKRSEEQNEDEETAEEQEEFALEDEYQQHNHSSKTKSVYDNAVFEEKEKKSSSSSSRRRTSQLMDLLNSHAQALKQIATSQRHPSVRYVVTLLVCAAVALGCAYFLGAFNNVSSEESSTPATPSLVLTGSDDGSGGKAHIVAHVPDNTDSFFNARKLLAQERVAGVAVVAVRTFKNDTAQSTRRSVAMEMVRVPDQKTAGSSKSDWRLDLSGIPADVPGSETHFEALAKDAADDVLYSGRSPSVTIRQGVATRISMRLLDVESHRQGATSGSGGLAQIASMVVNPASLSFCTPRELDVPDDEASCIRDARGTVGATIVVPPGITTVNYSWRMGSMKGDAGTSLQVEREGVHSVHFADSALPAAWIETPIIALSCGAASTTECTAMVELVLWAQGNNTQQPVDTASVGVEMRKLGSRASIDMAFHTAPEVASLRRVIAETPSTNQPEGCNPEDVELEATFADADVNTKHLVYTWHIPDGDGEECKAIPVGTTRLSGSVMRANSTFPSVRAHFRLSPGLDRYTACVFNVTVTDGDAPELAASANLTYIYPGASPAGIYSNLPPHFEKLSTFSQASSFSNTTVLSFARVCASTGATCTASLVVAVAPPDVQDCDGNPLTLDPSTFVCAAPAPFVANITRSENIDSTSREMWIGCTLSLDAGKVCAPSSATVTATVKTNTDKDEDAPTSTLTIPIHCVGESEVVTPVAAPMSPGGSDFTTTVPSSKPGSTPDDYVDYADKRR